MEKVRKEIVVYCGRLSQIIIETFKTFIADTLDFSTIVVVFKPIDYSINYFEISFTKEKHRYIVPKINVSKRKATL